MRPNSIRRAATPVVRRTRLPALVCLLFVLAVGIAGAVSVGPAAPHHAARGSHVYVTMDVEPYDGTFYSPNLTATVAICGDSGSIVSTSANLNGNTVPFNGGLRAQQCGGLGTPSDSGTVTMTLAPGSNSLTVTACDEYNSCDQGYGNYTYIVPIYGMTVTAGQSADTFPSGGTSSPSFTVHNTGNSQTTVDWSASCSGGSLRCTGTTSGSFVLASSASQSTQVSLSDTVQGTGSKVTFRAWYPASPSPVDSVSTPVTVWAPAPTVTALHSQLAVTPGVTVTDTFTVAVGPDGAGPYTLSQTCDPVLNCTLSPAGDTISANGSQRAVLSFRAPYTIANQSRWVSVAAVGATAGSQSGSGSGLVNVGQGTIANVTVTLDQSTLTLLVADSTQARATVTYADSSKVQNAPATWSFTTGGVAAVNSNGFVTAQGVGTTSIQATVGVVRGSAPLAVSSATGVTATMQGINPQGSIAREQCLTIAAGGDAAYECGDLRLVHPLPGVSTMNRARAPTLIYNSRHSKPTMLIAVDVLVTNDTASQLQASLTIGGRTLTRTYPWGSSCANVVCRIVFPVPADSLILATGWYTDSLQVTAGTYSASVLGGIAIVNRTTSPFGAGWWLDGLEQLVQTGDTTTMLWVTGDGSTRLYHATGAPDSVFTVQDVVDRPDTLIKSRADTTWRRHVGNNAIVQFNNVGQHIRTINRQGDTTRFVYDARTTALDSIILPSPSATRPAYTFQYDTLAHGYAFPLLKQVQSPGASGLRTTTLAPTGAWQVTQITDPDTTTVGFAWDTTNNRIVSRRNRKNDTTTYTYDAAGALNRVSVAMRAPDSALVTTFCAAETRTLAVCAGDGTGLRALPLDSVVTRMDGPRTDSVDVTRLFVNRFGAPDTVIDAHAGHTRVQRDATFPALADAVINPIGFEQDAVYSSRGLLQSSTAKNPFSTGQDATTRYGYDPKWDFVDTITAPTGEVSYFSYDATTGNRLWQRAGQDTATAVRFFYNAHNQINSILAPAHGASQHVAYDTTLGNVSQTTTPMGYHTDITRDAIGAETVIKTPTDAQQTDSLRKVERLGYDIMGRVLADTSIGAVMSYPILSPISITRDTAPVTADTLITSHAYDAEGRRISTLAVASWSPNQPVDCCPVEAYETWSYDAAGRVRFHGGNGKTDSTYYDPAGNVTRVAIASGGGYAGGFSQQFDALNRRTQRSVAAHTYPLQKCVGFKPGPLTGGTQRPCIIIFPAYPNNSTKGYTIPADTASFTYDQAGHLLTADNGDAKVHRQYFPGGAPKLDSATYLNALRNAFDHAKGIALQYDLSGRRTQLTLPDGRTIAYTYSSDNGLLTTVTDPTSTQHRYVYDRAQRVDSIVVAANGVNGVWEGRSYDDDDRAYRRTRSATLGGLNQDSMIFDAQGRITRALHATRANGAADDTTDIWYSGLGAVLARERRDANGNWETEEFRVDALGNVLRDRAYSSGNPTTWTTALGSVFERHSAGQLMTRGSDTNRVYSQQSDTLIQAFDAAGNTVLTQHQALSTTTPPAYLIETAGLNYYGWDGKLRVAQRYAYVDGGSNENGAFEEYRYDALGRRVLVVTQRDGSYPACDSLYACEPLCTGMHDCESKVLWTTWDAQQILTEVREQYPSGDPGPPDFNTVSYVHGLELDHPLAVLDPTLSGGLRIPIQQWRGLFESSVTQTGAAADFSLSSGNPQYIAWPAGQAVYSHPAPVDNRQNFSYTWGGTLLADGQDATGQTFRRNRYYDGDAGRFTQEDPIGLGGGMNLYGFAGGDPVNTSDPFGLCPCASDVIKIAQEIAARTAGLRALEPEMLVVASLPTLGAGDAPLAVVSISSKATVAEEGIYEFQAASGKTYVGQSGQISERLVQHLKSGKLAASDATAVARTEVLGGKTAREVAEQVRINKLGGIENLENKVNPIGANRQDLLPKPPQP
jgi:RHS repeat-associated protein